MNRFLTCLSFSLIALSVLAEPDQPNIPIIAILGQYGSTTLSKQFPVPDKYYTYVTGSYVDWVGITGGMAMLVPFDLPRSTLDYLLSHSDMFLIPGGGTPLDDHKGGPSDFQQTVNYVFDWAKKKNDNGTYYPVWGTCNGFEASMIYWANTTKILRCDFNDTFKDHVVTPNSTNLPNSKFWNNLNATNRDYVWNNGFAFYDHGCGVSPSDFYANERLAQNAYLMGTSLNDQGAEFIAMAEDKKYPFFATQWHPEKHQFERGPANAFCDKSTPTIKFMSEIIQELVDRVRATSKVFSKIPSAVKPYLSMYQTPYVIGYNNFERVYMTQRVIADLKAHEEKPQSAPITDGLGVWPGRTSARLAEGLAEVNLTLTQ